MGQSTMNGEVLEAALKQLQASREPDRNLDAAIYAQGGNFRGYMPVGSDRKIDAHGEDGPEMTEGDFIPLWAEPWTLVPGDVEIHVGERRYRESAPAYTSDMNAITAAIRERWPDFQIGIAIDPDSNMAGACIGRNAMAGFPLSVSEHINNSPQPAIALSIVYVLGLLARKEV